MICPTRPTLRCTILRLHGSVDCSFVWSNSPPHTDHYTPVFPIGWNTLPTPTRCYLPRLHVCSACVATLRWVWISHFCGPLRFTALPFHYHTTARNFGGISHTTIWLIAAGSHTPRTTFPAPTTPHQCPLPLTTLHTGPDPTCTPLVPGLHTTYICLILTFARFAFYAGRSTVLYAITNTYPTYLALYHGSSGPHTFTYGAYRVTIWTGPSLTFGLFPFYTCHVLFPFYDSLIFVPRYYALPDSADTLD